MAYDFPNTPTTGQIVTLGSAQWQWDGVKWASLPGPVLSAQRNVLHNPYFNVQQRGAGAWTTGYTADRWIISLTNDTVSVSLVALADSDRATIGDEAAVNGLQYTFTGSSTAGSYNALLQHIESVRRLSGKTVTFSFWARATSGTPRIGLSIYQFFGVGGSPSTGVTTTLGATPALSTWQRYSFTGILPSSSGKTFGTTAGTDYTQLSIWTSDQGNAGGSGIGVQAGTVQFWGMQLEVGNAATPLEKIDPRFDLANCQRFYQVATVQVAGYNTAGSGQYSTWYFVVTMRAAPTVGWLTGPSGANSSVSSFAANDNHSAVCNMAYTATGSAYIGGQTYASADL